MHRVGEHGDRPGVLRIVVDGQQRRAEVRIGNRCQHALLDGEARDLREEARRVDRAADERELLPDERGRVDRPLPPPAEFVRPALENTDAPPRRGV